ncbi:MAG: RNA ligase family protein [Acidobacteriota bacterium]|nr:RNA ligase family protein [Acidobacteriota bacterium]
MSTTQAQKPLGIKNYGHIPHLPGSRMGPGDHKVNPGQDRICTRQARDRHDVITVTEKLDGSNVGVALRGGILHPLSRAGYNVNTSTYEQHWRFGEWVYEHQNRFLALLEEGERLVGEWLMQAHGTRYELRHEPFVAFDLMRGSERANSEEFNARVKPLFTTPAVLHVGGPLPIDAALTLLGTYGKHGALDPVEGAVWRVERKGKVDFLAKYVRPDKVDGCYLDRLNDREPVWNWHPHIQRAPAPEG